VSAQDFGANDWLVDEMYEQYLQDPSSVDPAWVEYFKTNKPGAAAATNSSAPTSSAPKGVPPIPKAQQQAATPAPAPVAPAPVAQRLHQLHQHLLHLHQLHQCHNQLFVNLQLRNQLRQIQLLSQPQF
jgi:2-oxoglutarate dehydrogenase complex dehydrogenase (E1) component-like enzyme